MCKNLQEEHARITTDEAKGQIWVSLKMYDAELLMERREKDSGPRSLCNKWQTAKK